MDSESIGRRVARLRIERGMSQQRLAQAAGVSLSLVSKVEALDRPATQAFIGAVARGLRVSISAVTGQPYGHDGGRMQAAAESVRAALGAMDYPAEGMAARGVDDLAADVARISELGQRGDYLAIGRELPPLLEELAVALAEAPEAARPRLHSLLAEALSGASAIGNVTGLLDLRDRVVDRIAAAAAVCDEPLRAPRVVWQRSTGLMAVGQYSQALGALERARAQLGSDPVPMDGPTRSMLGSLYMRMAVVCARAAQTEGTDRARQAWTHLDAAEEVARVMRTDRNDFGLAMGPTNVAMHRVAVAVELEQGAKAIDYGRALRIRPGTPKVRVGHFEMDLARAYALEGDVEHAVACLQRSRRAAPQQARSHPSVRSTVDVLAMRPRPARELTEFAGWLGVG